MVLSPSCPTALLPAHPASQPSRPPPPASAAMCAMPLPRGGQGRAAGHEIRRWAHTCTGQRQRCGSRHFAHGSHLALEIASLTPTQRSTIGAHSAGVIAACRDLCKAVAPRDNGGDQVTSGGVVAQPPVPIATCTSIRPSRPENHWQSVQQCVPCHCLVAGRAGQQAMRYGGGHTAGAALAVWQQTLAQGNHLALEIASLTPTQRGAVGVHSAGVSVACRDLCKAVAPRYKGGEVLSSGGASAQLPICIVTCRSSQPSRPESHGSQCSNVCHCLVAGRAWQQLQAMKYGGGHTPVQGSAGSVAAGP